MSMNATDSACSARATFRATVDLPEPTAGDADDERLHRPCLCTRENSWDGIEEDANLVWGCEPPLASVNAKLVALLIPCAGGRGCLSAPLYEATQQVDLIVAATTDVHGYLRGWDYYTNRPDSAARTRRGGDDRRLAAPLRRHQPRARRRRRHSSGHAAGLCRRTRRHDDGAPRDSGDERHAVRRRCRGKSRVQLRTADARPGDSPGATSRCSRRTSIRQTARSAFVPGLFPLAAASRSPSSAPPRPARCSGTATTSPDG